MKFRLLVAALVLGCSYCAIPVKPATAEILNMGEGASGGNVFLNTDISIDQYNPYIRYFWMLATDTWMYHSVDCRDTSRMYSLGSLEDGEYNLYSRVYVHVVSPRSIGRRVNDTVCRLQRN